MYFEGGGGVGFQLVIDGFEYELQDYTVTEAATPLTGDDSSGQVGSFSLVVKKPDLNIPGKPSLLREYGPRMLMGKDVFLRDSRKGHTVGRVTGVDDNYGSGLFQLTCESSLAVFNVFNVQAEPFIGRLDDAFDYYMSLTGSGMLVLTDPAVADRHVVLPGFHGELWVFLKQLASANCVDVALVGGTVVVRPIRVRTVVAGRDVDRGLTVGGDLAQFVEVNYFQNREIVEELVYPPGGWSEDVAVLSVNAGETVEEVVELKASVSIVYQPVMQSFVDEFHDSSSVYTVMNDAGDVVLPGAWASAGGSLTVSINEDTKSLTVTITAPNNFFTGTGEPVKTFSIGMPTFQGKSYSSLRIVGSGVAYEKNTLKLPTGVAPSRTGTDVGVTVDNPFVSSLNQAYRLGVRTVAKFAGRELGLTGTVLSVNRDDTGGLDTPPYSEFQVLQAGKTYGQVVTDLNDTYGGVQSAFASSVANTFKNQVFGNAAGARVWDARSGRWFRVREATVGLGLTQFNAESDMVFDDVLERWNGMTYNSFNSIFDGFTYDEAYILGVQ